MTSSPRVLMIQSHVVSGYCGNKSAVFPLQVLGLEVDFVNSVQFSNHTWYKGGFKGQVLGAEELGELYEGLKANHLTDYSYIITGYIGADSFLTKVGDIVQELKASKPRLTYVCDPVMGDDGVMYVPESLLPIYQEKILPLADVLLPNQFEAEKLTGMSIKTEEDIRPLLDALHDKGPHTVILTSTSLGQADQIVGYVSYKKGSSRKLYKMEVPRLDQMFIGTGDLFAALFLAWSHHHPQQIPLVASKVQSTMQHVLKKTMEYAKEQAPEIKDSKYPWQLVELRLIQSRKAIEKPDICTSVKEI